MQHEIIESTLAAGGRVLIAGPPGTGKSTLAATLAEGFANAGLVCIGCDPGSPAYGAPGAACVGIARGDGWELIDVEPICSLDAARFRLPLVEAAAALLERTAPGPCVLDAPGTYRGAPSAELISALARRLRADLVVLLERGDVAELAAELDALCVRILRLPASPLARAPSKRARARHRTALWNAYLDAGGIVCEVDVDALRLIGTPPPLDVPSAWQGRQVALLRAGGCVAFGEVVGLDAARLRLRVRGDPDGATALMIRDARRARDGLLGTAEPFPQGVTYRGPRDPRRSKSARAASLPRVTETEGRDVDGDRVGTASTEPQPLAAAELRPVVHVGPFTATLLNGVFRDPLLLVKLRHSSRMLLFDIGETPELDARTAHAVTDVFITHAHIDHIGGFLRLLRLRIGESSVCRIHGPPGLAANIAGLVSGVHWDRAGEGAPRFTVAELHPDETLHRFAVHAGEQTARLLEVVSAPDGRLLDESTLNVHAVTLDHLTPVLAFALESTVEINVRKERLAELGARPGPWLTALKQAIAAGRCDELIELPDGSRRAVGELADFLVLIRPGTKLVYATDLADTESNRRRLTELARNADVLFCESTFLSADADRAARTGHLTTRACGEIATAAKVARLVPFHFSRRYETDPGEVYREVRAACSSAVMPQAVRHE